MHFGTPHDLGECGREVGYDCHYSKDGETIDIITSSVVCADYIDFTVVLTYRSSFLFLEFPWQNN